MMQHRLGRFFKPSNYVQALKAYCRYSTYIEACRACKRQWDLNELERIQLERLNAIVAYAYKHIDLYRRRFNLLRVKPEDIKTCEDLAKLPTLNKEDIRTHFPDLVVPNIRLKDCTFRRSSGSTGEPTVTVKDDNARIYEESAIIRQRLACGVGFGERFLNVTPSKPGGPYLDSLGFHIVHNLNVMEEKKTDYLQRLKKMKITAIFGMSSWIRSLAYDVQIAGISNVKPKVVISSFELLHKETRKLVKDVFDTDIIDLYSCSEVHDIAWECPEHVGYHINADNVIVEILKDGEPVAEGELGEIVITCLYNYAMPLIRYKIGDMGTFTNEYCPCGRKLPLLKSIQGRSVDSIVLPDNRMIPPSELILVLSNYTGYLNFRVIQENKNLVVIIYAKDAGLTSEVLDDIVREFKRILGSNVEIKTVGVDTIPLAESSKLRWVVSKVTNPF